jgi:hypothetical protein
MKPFYLKCHPDLQTSEVAKKLNMEAVQTINGLIDSLDATCEGKLVDWPKVVPIEFLIAKEEITAKKKKPIQALTRRKVELSVPSVSLRDKIIQSTGPERLNHVNYLQRLIHYEFSKILKIAGLPVNVSPLYTPDEVWDSIAKDRIERQEDSSAGSSFDFDMEPKTKRDFAREYFFKSMDFDKLNRYYMEKSRDEEARKSMQGLIKKNPILRQNLVNGIIERVRVHKDANIEFLDQLVTLRRLSLLLEDNFDALSMEENGKMWEDMTIILLNPRTYSISGSALQKRRKRGEPSGFQFTYAADSRVTVEMPIDFKDDELLSEFKRNLSIWFEMHEIKPEDFLKPAY